MSRKYLVAALAAAVSGSIIPRDDCCFQISASGGVTGTLGQIYDGQNRVGGGQPPATYCLKDGGLYDKASRGCILTPPTTQWQCDQGAGPTYGFSIGPNGSAMYHGSAEFWACPVNDAGEYNIYTQPVTDQKKCVQVSLHTSSQCGAPPPPPSAPRPPPPPKYEPPKPEYKPTSAAAYQAPTSWAATAAAATTTYACNPAHEYPEGVKCVSTNGSLALVTPTAKP